MIKFSRLLFAGVIVLLCGLKSTMKAEDSAANVKSAENIGASACLACHDQQRQTPHGHFLSQKKGIEFEKSCEQCHGPGSLHAEAAGDKTNPNYATITSFRNASAAITNAACLSCHQDSKRLHWDGGKHDNKGLSCLSCHSVHSSQSKKGQLTKSTEMETCAQCHSDVKSQIKRTAHMPLTDGKMSCSSCHNPHGSASDKNLVSANANALCTSCHAEKRGPVIWQHPPVMENCLNCHTPHGSHHDKMLNAKMPLLCQRCHNVSQHPSTPYGGGDVTSRTNKVFAQSCLNCHPAIHGSNHPSGKMLTR